MRHITFILPDNVTETATKNLESLNIEFVIMSSLSKMMALFSDGNFKTDLIIFDLAGLNAMPDTNIFDLVNTIKTLSICVIQKTEDGLIDGKNVILAAAVEVRADPQLIKSILSTEVDGIFPLGPEFSVDEKNAAITRLLFGEHYVPQKIKDVIRPQKTTKITNKIQLTSRQEQVLSLICERGASNKIIARTLKISESAVKLHVTHIFKKYGARNRTQLVLFATKDYT